MNSLHPFVAGVLVTLAPMAAHATGVYSASARACSEAIEAASAELVTVVHDEIRASIRDNLEAKTHACSGPLVCSGGPMNGTPCTDNSTCGAAGGMPFECQPQLTAGIAGVFNQAKADLRGAIAAACSPADLNALYGVAGSARCADPSTPDDGLTSAELAECIIRSTAGNVGREGLIGTVGGILARGAPNVAVDDPAPLGICSVTLGRRIDSGSAAPEGRIFTVGGVEPLLADGCVAGNPLCNTKGAGVPGNLIDPPTQTYAGIIPICIASRSADTGNGTPQSGWINLATGEQFSRSGIVTQVFLGVTCPVCTAATGTCGPAGTGGPHEGATCNHLGETDIACPPTAGPYPIFGGLIDESTEVSALVVPAHDPAGGVTNPAASFCGHCDLDDSTGCGKDQDCDAMAVCSGGTGSGCCEFGPNVGAFGDPQRTAIHAYGTRGPFIAGLAGVACLGATGSQLVDSVLGLPGPVRSLQTRLNVIQYDSNFPTPIPTLVPTATLAGVATMTPTPTLTLTRTATKTRTRRGTPTRTPTRRPKPADRCRSIEDCRSRCSGDDAFCSCFCFNQYCQCSGRCQVRVCPPP